MGKVTDVNIYSETIIVDMTREDVVFEASALSEHQCSEICIGLDDCELFFFGLRGCAKGCYLQTSGLTPAEDFTLYTTLGKFRNANNWLCLCK